MATRFADLVLEFEFDDKPDDDCTDEEWVEWETKLATRQEELIAKINAVLVAESASVSEG